MDTAVADMGLSLMETIYNAVRGMDNTTRARDETRNVDALEKATPEQYAKKIGLPTYEIPEGVKRALNLLETQSRSDMPGAQQARDEASRSLAMNLSSAGQQNTPFGAMAQQNLAMDRYERSMRDLNSQAAQYRATQQGNLASFYAGPYAQEEQKMFQYNEMLPVSLKEQEYWQRKRAADAMMGVGYDYMGTSLSNLTDAAGSYAQSQYWSPQTAQPQQSSYGSSGQTNIYMNKDDYMDQPSVNPYANPMT